MSNFFDETTSSIVEAEKENSVVELANVSVEQEE